MLCKAVFNRIQDIDPEKFWVDLDMGQLDSDGYKSPITYLTILLKFEDVIWKNMNESVQIGLVNLTVKYAHRFTSESEMMTGDVLRVEIRECLNALQVIHERLGGVSGSSFSVLTRFNQYQRKTNPTDLLWVNVIQYQCNIQSIVSLLATTPPKV